MTARKQAEVALQEANRQITTIWESMTDAYVTLDRECRVVYANSTATQVVRALTGLEPEEFLGKSHWEIFPSLVGQPVEQAYRQAVVDQVAAHLEVWYEPTGNWFEAHAYPSPAGLGIYFRDISVAKRLEEGRKRTEETVQQQFHQIESIYTTAPIGLCFIDTDLKFVRINERLAEINGLPVSEHLERTLREILPEMADHLEPLYRQVIDSGEPILNLEVEDTNRAQPGVLRHWLVCFYPQKDLHQRIVGVNVMVQEITKRKRIEAELREREEQLRLFVQYAPAGVAMFDREMRYIAVSDRWLTSYGLDNQNVIGRSHYEIFPEVSQRWKDIHQRCLAGAVERCEEDCFPRPNGSIEWVRWEIRPWRTNTGEIGGIIVFSEVITDRKQAQLRSEFLVTVSQALTSTTSIKEMVQTIGEHLNRYVNTSRFALVEINEAANEAYVNHTWQLPGVPSLTGVYQIQEFITDELRFVANASFCSRWFRICLRQHR